MKIKIEMDEQAEEEVIIRCRGMTEQIAAIQRAVSEAAGPVIKDWGIKDGKAWISCSPVNHINFVAGNIINDGVMVLGKACEDSLTYGEYEVKGHEAYIRVEVTDKYGRTAWTNPIYLDWK